MRQTAKQRAWAVLTANHQRYVRWAISDDGWVQLQIITPNEGAAEIRAKEVGLTQAEIAMLYGLLTSPNHIRDTAKMVERGVVMSGDVGRPEHIGDAADLGFGTAR